MAHDRARHGAKARLAKSVLAPAGEFRRDLVPPGRPARAAFDDRVVVEPERQQHRLFQPLVDLPRRRPLRAVDLFGDARLTGIEHFERLGDGVADVAAGVGVDLGAVLEGAFDEGLQLGHVTTAEGKGGGSFRSAGAVVNGRPEDRPGVLGHWRPARTISRMSLSSHSAQTPFGSDAAWLASVSCSTPSSSSACLNRPLSSASRLTTG